MAIAFSPPAVTQKDYPCMLLEEDFILFLFFAIVSKIRGYFCTCSISVPSYFAYYVWDDNLI